MQVLSLCSRAEPLARTPLSHTMSLFPGGLMKQSPFPIDSCDSGWRDLYIAALFENDRAKLAERIVIAQRAIGAEDNSYSCQGRIRKKGKVSTLHFLHFRCWHLPLRLRPAWLRRLEPHSTCSMQQFLWPCPLALSNGTSGPLLK